jgi:GNAT superfamily N-acetyltransferase
VTDPTVRLETVVVHHLGGTPFHGFAVQVHAALLAAGLCDPRDPLVYPGDGAILARVGEDLVGVITYRYYEDAMSLRACAAYVLPDWRRRGVFRLMHEELVRVAAGRRAGRIEARSLATNAAFRAAACASGMVALSTLYAMDVSPQRTEP